VPDVVDVVNDPEPAFDHFTDAGAGPEGGGESVGLGTLEQIALQLFLSGGRQLCGPAEVGFRFQALEAVLAVSGFPKADGAAVDAQLASDINGALPLLEQFDGLVAAFLKLIGFSGWAHGVTSGKEYRILFIQESIAPGGD
jgi:hypothetical protein